MIKDAKSDNKGFESKAGTKYLCNINEDLGKMLLDGLLKSGQVIANENHVFNDDNPSKERMPSKLFGWPSSRKVPKSARKQAKSNP